MTRWPAGRAFDLETAQHFPGIDASKVRSWGDPAGDSRAQTDEDTPFKILRAAGIKADPAPTNDIDIRIEVVSNALNRLIDGQPGLIVPRCVTIHKGFVSGYRYRRMQITGTDKYDVVPDKNRFSHPHELVAIHAARRRRGPPAHPRRYAGQVDRHCPRVGRVCQPASVIAQLEQIQDLRQP